jgi:hypothetical protein
MIAAFLLEDKDQPGNWWCFFKQHGVSFDNFASIGLAWNDDLSKWDRPGKI